MRKMFLGTCSEYEKNGPWNLFRIWEKCFLELVLNMRRMVLGTCYEYEKNGPWNLF